MQITCILVEKECCTYSYLTYKEWKNFIRVYLVFMTFKKTKPPTQKTLELKFSVFPLKRKKTQKSLQITPENEKKKKLFRISRVYLL